MRVFISYSHSDQALAHLLAYILDKAGISCDIDRGIRTGRFFDEEIKRMIRQADLVLVLLTRSSLSSAWVNQEIGFAIAHEKEVWPLALEDGLEPAGMITTREYYSLLDWSNPSVTIENLVRALGKDVHGPQRDTLAAGMDHVLTGKLERTRFLNRRLQGLLDAPDRPLSIYHQAGFSAFCVSDSPMYAVPGEHSPEYLALLLQERRALDAVVNRPNTTLKLILWPKRPYGAPHLAARFETLLDWLREKEDDDTIEVLCAPGSGPQNRLIVAGEFVLEGYKTGETSGYQMSVARYQPEHIRTATEEFLATWNHFGGSDKPGAIRRIEEMYQEIDAS